MFNKLLLAFKSEHPGYINDIDNLTEYMDSHQINLAGVCKETIRDSIEWLTVDRGKFHSQATAQKYMNAVVTLFRWLIENGLENSAFQQQYRIEPNRKNSYWFLCKEYILGCPRLEESESHTALEDDDVRTLISNCNTEIENYADRGDRSEPVAFSNMVSAIIIKIILLTGARYRIIRSIPYSAYNQSTKRLSISGVDITIPFVQQFEQYISVLGDIPPQYLFVQYDRKQLPEKMAASVLRPFLLNYLNRASIEEVAKVGTQQLLKCYIPETIIKRMTGAQDKAIQDCFEASFLEHNWTDVVNTKLEETGFYKLLNDM